MFLINQCPAAYKGGSFGDHTQDRILHPQAHSSTQENSSTYGMNGTPENDPKSHSCLAGQQLWSKCPAQIGQGTVLVLQDLAFKCSKGGPQNDVRDCYKCRFRFLGSLRAYGINGGIRDQESKSVTSALGVSHTRPSLRTTGHRVQKKGHTKTGWHHLHFRERHRESVKFQDQKLCHLNGEAKRTLVSHSLLRKGKGSLGVGTVTYELLVSMCRQST